MAAAESSLDSLGLRSLQRSNLSYHLQLAVDLGTIPKSEYARLDARTDQVRRMLSSLVSKVKQGADAPPGVGKKPTASDQRPITRPS